MMYRDSGTIALNFGRKPQSVFCIGLTGDLGLLLFVDADLWGDSTYTRKEFRNKKT